MYWSLQRNSKTSKIIFFPSKCKMAQSYLSARGLRFGFAPFYVKGVLRHFLLIALFLCFSLSWHVPIVCSANCLVMFLPKKEIINGHVLFANYNFSPQLYSHKLNHIFKQTWVLITFSIKVFEGNLHHVGWSKTSVCSFYYALSIQKCFHKLIILLTSLYFDTIHICRGSQLYKFNK